MNEEKIESIKQDVENDEKETVERERREQETTEGFKRDEGFTRG